MPSSAVAQAVRRILDRRVGAAASLLAMAATAQAQGQGLARTVTVDIAPQKIPAALIELSSQADIQVLMPGLIADQLETQGVRGTMSVEGALSKLLEGTSLRFRVAGNDIVGIEAGDARAQETKSGGSAQSRAGGAALGSGRIRLAQSDQAGGAGPQAADSLEEVVVTSKIIFTENDAFGATKMGLALKDTPQSVMVVTSDMIEFSGIRSFNDLYKIDASGGSAHTFDGYPRNYYRGFRQQGANAIRVDGFRMPGNIDLDLALFDRVEVIKGATSTLYGQTSIAGTLNAVSKLPQDHFGGEVSVEGGQFDEYRLEADVAGPIGGSEQWSYRLIGAYRDGNSFIDYSGTSTKLLAPSIQYRPDDSTKLTLRAIYQETDILHHFASILQLAGTGTGEVLDRVLDEGLQIADVPRSRFFGMPWNHTGQDARFVQFQGEHVFRNDWTLRAHAQYNQVKLGLNGLLTQAPYDEDGFAYFTYAYGHDDTDELYGAEVNLFGEVEILGREHTLFFGLDYNEISRESDFGGSVLSVGFEGSLFNLFRPDYGAVAPYRHPDDYGDRFDSDNESKLFGATMQMILRPADRLSVLLGGRYSVDSLTERSRSGTADGSADDIDNQAFETTADVEFREFVFQGGVTYEVSDSFNLYASYGRTFDPRTDLVFVAEDEPGELIDPEVGTNYEIGMKGSLSSDLSVTMAVFDMERTNIAQADRGNPGFSVAIGTQRSRGVELGVQGRLMPELSVFASLAYLDAEYSEGEYEGLQPPNAPRFGISAFGSYEILDGPLKGLGFGLGAVYKTGRETFDATWSAADSGNAPVVFDFGSFTEVDARVFYGRGPWEVSLAATNLFNEKYYSPTFEELDFATHVNPPLTLMARVARKF